MQCTKEEAREELEKFWPDPISHVGLGTGFGGSVEIRVTTTAPGITQMLKEHFACYSNVNIEYVGPIRSA